MNREAGAARRIGRPATMNVPKAATVMVTMTALVRFDLRMPPATRRVMPATMASASGTRHR